MVIPIFLCRNLYQKIFIRDFSGSYDKIDISSYVYWCNWVLENDNDNGNNNDDVNKSMPGGIFHLASINLKANNSNVYQWWIWDGI